MIYDTKNILMSKEAALPDLVSRMLNFFDEVYLDSLQDYASKVHVRLYKQMGLSEDEIKSRITKQFAASKDILLPVTGIPLAENTFTIAEHGAIHFETIDYCLGIIMENSDGIAFGAHVLAIEDGMGDEHLQDKADQVVKQAKRFYPFKPHTIKFISPHVGNTLQHRKIFDAFIKTYPGAKVEKIRNVGI